MSSIGIIGAGIAGLQLGLFVRDAGIDATIYTARDAEQLMASRMTNMVIRSAPTRERERLLNANHWDGIAPDLVCMRVQVAGARRLGFCGRFEQPAHAVDMRIYCAQLLSDFAARGGRVVAGELEREDVERAAAEHELLVVATGRGRLAGMFPRLAQHSPYRTPQRVVLAALYRGIDPGEQPGFDVVVVPGHGELIMSPIWAVEPGLTGIGVEIVPHGPWKALTQLRGHARDAAVLGLLREHAPAIYARVDTGSFGLPRSLDICHAAVTPTVRRGYTRLGSGSFVLALGDAQVLNDPLTGQGANTASLAAWIAGQAIAAGGPFDERFCRRVEQRIWRYTRSITLACNTRLGPPPAHFAALLGAAARNQTVADLYARGFHHPDQWWAIISSPARTAELIQQHSVSEPAENAVSTA